MVDISALTSASASTSIASSDAKSLANDFDDFLVLLTTQLQYQDPLDPMDSGEFTGQLVAFAGVEQQIKTNDNLETIASLTSLNNISNVAGYLGMEALIESPYGDHDSDGVKWQYSNFESVKEVTLKVVNEDGETIYEQAGSTGAGIHSFNWDGTTTEGTLAPPGTYQLKATARDPEDNSTTVGVAVQETITGADTSGYEPFFTIGPNVAVAQTEILRLLAQK